MHARETEEKYLSADGEFKLGRPVAAAIVLRNGARQKDVSVLLGARKDPEFKGKKFPPGGTVEPGETAILAATRELGEETGMNVDVSRIYPYASDNLMGIYSFSKAKLVRPFYPYQIVVWDKHMGEPRNLIPTKTDDWVWQDLDNFLIRMDSTIPTNVACILDYVIHNILSQDKTWFRKRGLNI